MTVTETRATFDSLNPITGDVVATHPVHSDEEVRAAVARAHEAAAWWSALTYDERETHLTAWKGVITRRIAQLADVMHQETGKPHGDAMLEAALAIDHLAWAAGHAEKVLKRRRVPSGLVMANQAASVAYLPARRRRRDRSVELPRLHADGLDRLRAGGGQRGRVQAERVHARCRRVAGPDVPVETVGRPVLQVVTGLGETGAALCRAGVDKVAFTGSTETGKRVMAACAETLTPVVIEAGGKDALIVDADADIEAAADAALWGACANAGQTCAGVERVYVHERVYDEFLDSSVDQVAGAARRRRPGCAARPDHDAQADGHHPLAHPGRPGPRRPRGGRRRRRGGRAVRAADDPGRRTGGLAGRAGGDLRPDGDGGQGARHGRGGRRWPTARATPWARRSSPRHAGWRSPSGSAPA